MSHQIAFVIRSYHGRVIFFNQSELPFFCQNCFLNELFFQISFQVGLSFGNDFERYFCETWFVKMPPITQAIGSAIQDSV